MTRKRAVILKHFSDFRQVARYSDEKIGKILDDDKMIRNRRKIEAAVHNAHVLERIVDKYGSFQEYLNSMNPENSFEDLMLFKEEVEYKFEYLGGITAYHFMTDLGLPVLKPDRVLTRLFLRLGLLDNTRQLLKAVIQGRKFSEATGEPIRYIDLILVYFGQAGGEAGIRRGVCLAKPECHRCRITQHCRSYSEASDTE